MFSERSSRQLTGAPGFSLVPHRKLLPTALDVVNRGPNRHGPCQPAKKKKTKTVCFRRPADHGLLHGVIDVGQVQFVSADQGAGGIELGAPKIFDFKHGMF
jgi:hypothetical protein